MMITFQTYAPDFVATVRAGGPDAYGLAPEHGLSPGPGTPCRCCLSDIPAGQPMLIVAARPFAALHPYAETGPVFFCAADCAPWAGEGVPPVLQTSPDYLLKGYSAQERIVYGTGRVVAVQTVPSYAEEVFADPEIAYVDVRSSRNNCFLTRIIRGDPRHQ